MIPSLFDIPQRALDSLTLFVPLTGFSLQRAREDATVPAFHDFLNAPFSRLARTERSQSGGRISLLGGTEIDVTRRQLFSLLWVPFIGFA